MPIDPSAVVAPTARIHEGAQIGPRTVIGDYAIVEDNVAIGADCKIEPYVFIKRWTTLGDRNSVSAGAALGTDPFDKAFTGERSYLRIGDDNIIREHFTISRGTKPESITTIGNGNFIMSGGHIAHNCTVGNNCVVAANSLLAGYVQMEDNVFISGCCTVHQFSKIGKLAMIGGLTRINMDAAPFFMYVGGDMALKGLNLVGLRRAGFSRERVSALKTAYRILYRSGLKLEAALERIASDVPTEDTRHLISFIQNSDRGIRRE